MMGQMSGLAWLTVFVCACQLALAILATTRLTRSALALPIALMGLVMAMWNFAALGYELTGHPSWRYLDTSVSVFTTPTAVHFFVAFVGRRATMRWAVVLAYVLAAAGRAYLAERKPKLARYYLEAALDKSPGSLEIQFRLFYVYADLQLHSKALELAQALLEDLPPVYQLPGSNVVQGSEEYLSAAVLVGLARAYADQLAQSQQYFEQLSSSLPHNTDIRQELANVYRWRGWIDRSLSEYSQVLAVEPGLLSARIGHAHTMLDNRDFANVEKELRYLKQHYAFEPAVSGLEKRWNDHNRQELTVATSFGQSSGATFGEDQHQHGHGRRGRRHAPGTGDHRRQHLGRQGRGQDVDQVVAQEHRPDHRLLVGQQLVDPPRRPVALALQLVHPRAAGPRHRRLRRREQRRQGQQGDDDRREAEQGGEHGVST